MALEVAPLGGAYNPAVASLVNQGDSADPGRLPLVGASGGAAAGTGGDIVGGVLGGGDPDMQQSDLGVPGDTLPHIVDPVPTQPQTLQPEPVTWQQAQQLTLVDALLSCAGCFLLAGLSLGLVLTRRYSRA